MSIEVEPYRPSMHYDILHSWAAEAQDELLQLRQLCREQHEALIDCVSDAESGAFHVSVQSHAARLIKKYNELMK